MGVDDEGTTIIIAPDALESRFEIAARLREALDERTKGVQMGLNLWDEEAAAPNAYYDAIYTLAIWKQTELLRPWVEQPLRRYVWYPALLLARGAILDAGCGLGHLAAMARAFGIEYAAGFDQSCIAVEWAQRRYPYAAFWHSDLGWDLTEDSGPLPYDAFDYETVMLLEVLEHIDDDLGVLKLVPEGKTVVASVPSFETEGHVRCFESREAVVERYSHALEIDLVVVEKAQEGPNRWFTFRGVRR